MINTSTTQTLSFEYLIFVIAGFPPLFFGLMSIVERTAFVKARHKLQALRGNRAMLVGLLYISLGLPMLIAGVLGIFRADPVPLRQIVNQLTGNCTLGMVSVLIPWVGALGGVNLLGLILLHSSTRAAHTRHQSIPTTS